MKIEETILICGGRQDKYVFDIPYNIIFDNWSNFNNRLWEESALKITKYSLFDRPGGNKCVDKTYKSKAETIEELRERYIEMFKGLEVSPIKAKYPNLI